MIVVELGPVSSVAAQAWITNTRDLLDRLREHAHLVPFSVPDDVMATFRRYLDEWGSAADAADELRWTGAATTEEVEWLLRYWLTIDSLTDTDLGRIGATWAPPEAEPFYVALTAAIIGALEGDRSPLASRAGQWFAASGELAYGEIRRP